VNVFRLGRFDEMRSTFVVFAKWAEAVDRSTKLYVKTRPVQLTHRFEKGIILSRINTCINFQYVSLRNP
jgi:hypothetical protein